VNNQHENKFPFSHGSGRLMSGTDNKHNIFSTRPNLVAITMGCPVGIGPEIILSYLAKKKFPANYLPLVVGDIGVLQRCARELRINLEITAWKPGNPVDSARIHVVEPKRGAGYALQPASLNWGQPARETGHAAVAYIREAVRLIKKGQLDALVTCPIAKHAIQLAGYEFPGHTEMLASLCDTRDFGMMMAGRRLKVTLVTIHLPIAKVAEALNQEEVRRIIKLTGETLVRDFGMVRPRIAVAVTSEKWELAGPLPPDTVFKMALDNRYDAVVAMYHDQGLIPFKIVHFKDGVNLTMGLPIIRTSVDHGTAYDIAGKGIASDSSLKAAFLLATEIVGHRKISK
jgi:4-hydroxythreonine-4-phosphate dehydrogenase